MPEIRVVDKIASTARGTDGYGSTEKKLMSKAPPLPKLPVDIPTVHNRPAAAAAAKVYLPLDVDPVIRKCEEDLHFAFDMPYELVSPLHRLII